MTQDLLLAALGVAVGAYGTLIGAGGGFVLVPILLLLYPKDKPITITTISLAVVFFNALSGTSAYARMQRIDYRTGLTFALATVPGAIIGVFVTARLSRGPFNILMGSLLILVAIWVSVRPSPEDRPVDDDERLTHRTLVDASGVTYSYAFNRTLGLALSGLVGFLSSLLGIGGGIIHVPAMVSLLHIPAHVATATSQLILTITSLTGSVVHALQGDFHGAVGRTVAISIGVIAGAQVGARLSNLLHGTVIVRLLAVALALVGVRLIAGAI